MKTKIYLPFHKFHKRKHCIQSLRFLHKNRELQNINKYFILHNLNIQYYHKPLDITVYKLEMYLVSGVCEVLNS